jgi:hypothetical protein
MHDVHCPAGYLCGVRPNGATECMPADCFFRTLEPPDCGVPGAPCGECPASPECVPDCAGKECGLELTCATYCGTCPEGTLCQGNLCEPCEPDCLVIECGPSHNNCGSCGTCPEGTTCSNFGHCEP